MSKESFPFEEGVRRRRVRRLFLAQYPNKTLIANRRSSRDRETCLQRNCLRFKRRGSIRFCSWE
jgi:hypothetical protein